MSTKPRERDGHRTDGDVTPTPGPALRFGVALLAGGVTALVTLLLTPVVEATTPVQFSLAQLGAVAAGTGLLVAVDGARQPAPRFVVVRTSYVVAALVVCGGVALGVSLWLQPTPTPRTGQTSALGYAPLIPVVVGAFLGLLVAGFGVLYRRRTTFDASE